MTTEVVITGTGVPQVVPGCAGAGVLVRHGDTSLQFDAGRATSMRLASVGVRPPMLDALFLTHHHSDHLLGVADLVISRWIEGRADPSPLPIVAPAGPLERFVERLIDPWIDDLDVRAGHLGRTDSAAPRLRSFEVRHDMAVEVWSNDQVRVLARGVHHEPVEPAVAYRIETSDGAIVVSGDTIVCDEMADLIDGAAVVVHEAFRRDVILAAAEQLPHLRHIAEYHADTVELGRMAAAAAVPTLVLTHLIPPLGDDPETAAAGFVDDVRRHGFAGDLVVARDLTTITLADGVTSVRAPVPSPA